MAHIVANRVRETSTTTGTGALTLAGAATGAIAFSAAPGMAVGATLYYTAEAVDAGGALTGDWEMGLGTYSAASTLTRTTVLASSNAGALVSFAAGTKRVFITVPAEQVAWARERLTAARTYYVRTDGSDSNTGLANTAGGAFLTLQKAVDVVYALDLSIYDVTIQLADGTYGAGCTATGPAVGKGSITIQGNAGTPANVLLSATTADVIVAEKGAKLVVKDLKLTNTGNFLLRASTKAHIDFSGVNFGSTAAQQIRVDDYGTITCTGNYSISGGGAAHIGAVAGMLRVQSKTVTLTGTPAFSSAFADLAYSAIAILNGNTYSGSATGARYTVIANSVVHTAGAGATYLPGNAAHATPTATGGQYV